MNQTFKITMILNETKKVHIKVKLLACNSKTVSSKNKNKNITTVLSIFGFYSDINQWIWLMASLLKTIYPVIQPVLW